MFTNYTFPKKEFTQYPVLMDLLNYTAFDYLKEDQVKELCYSFVLITGRGK